MPDNSQFNYIPVDPNTGQELGPPVPGEQFQSHEDVYGTSVEQAKAGALGLAEGIAGPLGTAAARQLGMSPEEQEGVKEENPVIYQGLKAAGLIAPAFAEGPGMGLTQTGALETAGRTVAEGLGLTGAAGTATKMGVEAALYTAGDELSKAINDKPDTVQQAITHIGLSGILGAGIGYPLGTVSDLWTSKMGPKAEQFAMDFANGLRRSDGMSAAQIADIEGIPFSPSAQEPIKNLIRPGTPLFTQEEVETAIPQSLGDKFASFVTKKANDIVSEGMSDVAGALMGGMSGIPGGRYIGGMFGHYTLKPLMKTMLPALIKPILNTAASGEGLRAAFDTIDSIMSGSSMIDKAAKSLFEMGTTGSLNELMPEQKKLDALDTRVQDLSQHPEAMLTIGGSSGHYLPQTQVSMAKTAQNAVSYLSQVKPKDTQPGPMDKKIPPTSEDRAAYNRTLAIAEQPLVVLSYAKNGSLRPSDMTTLQTLYPALNSTIQQRVGAQMINHLGKDNTIPYKTRQGLSTLLGQPLDSTLKPGFIMAAQSTFVPTQPQMAPQASKMPQKRSEVRKGTAKIGKSAELARTPLQMRQTALYSK